ncbi:hypothetical protein AGMMS49545_18410 [Betaproteobacteria bacterium]|nr:hypothetical protein AGMMS49545_18410 [Betaproteobacteria bacterium]
MCGRGIGFEPGSAGVPAGGFKIFRAEPTPPAGTPALPATANLAANIRTRHTGARHIRARHAVPLRGMGGSPVGARRAVPYGGKAAPDDCHLTSDP